MYCGAYEIKSIALILYNCQICRMLCKGNLIKRGLWSHTSLIPCQPVIFGLCTCFINSSDIQRIPNLYNWLDINEKDGKTTILDPTQDCATVLLIWHYLPSVRGVFGLNHKYKFFFGFFLHLKEEKKKDRKIYMYNLIYGKHIVNTANKEF